jgi:hypothetical protein
LGVAGLSKADNDAIVITCADTVAEIYESRVQINLMSWEFFEKIPLDKPLDFKRISTSVRLKSAADPGDHFLAKDQVPIIIYNCKFNRL